MDQCEDDFQAFFQGLEELLVVCEEKELFANFDDTEYCQEALRSAVNALTYIESHQSFQEHSSPDLIQSIQDLRECFVQLKTTWDSIQLPFRACSVPTVVAAAGDVLRTGSAGRPSAYINLEQVAYLLNNGFKLTHIANMFLLNRTTLWRRLRYEEFYFNRYTNVSDDELLNIMRNIHQHHPHTGVSLMIGHLRAHGIIVQQQRIRTTLRTLDPANSALRWGLVALRRSYSVQGPNSLWHIDGHHKLIRWKIVTHGGIDGFSRLIVFLKCSNNNLADTVLCLFMGAVDNFSLPSRVRGDKGSENFSVANYMEQQRGTNRGSFIFGKSVHNCRIERLWRDVFYSVIQTFYSLFYYLESADELNIDNDIDMFCLHYVFIPRINAALVEFKEAYNNHNMRTEHNWSPYRMWINGRNSLTNYRHDRYLINNNEAHLSDMDLITYGIDPDEVLEVESTDEQMPVEPLTMPFLSFEIVSGLTTLVNPLDFSDDLGADLFQKAKQIVRSYLTDGDTES